MEVIGVLEIDERNHGRFLRHVQRILRKAQTFEGVDVLGRSFGGDFEVFLDIPRKRSLDAQFYLLQQEYPHAPLGLREPRRLHPSVVYVEEGLYLLVAFFDTLLSGLFAVVV